ncbi:hypothetical protein LI064_02810 [Clostridium perfringens]|uniref:hypothetical protein n=1 Tax=Clostridium perfringens TaxID=1502 RepID=UPI002245C363|nr:hypothetical protein [Clostridium perfringens]MCX0353453.1 hypothetical protein [Clostridium perfringens]
MEDINLLETEGRILKTYKAENRDLILELNIGDLKDNYWYEVLVEDKRGISTYITRFKEEKFLKERKGRLGHIISRYFKNNIYFLIEEYEACLTRRGDCNEK